MAILTEGNSQYGEEAQNVPLHGETALSPTDRIIQGRYLEVRYKVPLQMLVSEWLSEQCIPTEQRLYLLEKVLPLLLIALENLMTNVFDSGAPIEGIRCFEKETYKDVWKFKNYTLQFTMEGTMNMTDGVKVIPHNKLIAYLNPVTWLAQFLMRYNPVYETGKKLVQKFQRHAVVRVLGDLKENVRIRFEAEEEQRRIEKLRAEALAAKEEQERQKLGEAEYQKKKYRISHIISSLDYCWVVNNEKDYSSAKPTMVKELISACKSFWETKVRNDSDMLGKVGKCQVSLDHFQSMNNEIVEAEHIIEICYEFSKDFEDDVFTVFLSDVAQYIIDATKSTTSTIDEVFALSGVEERGQEITPGDGGVTVVEQSEVLYKPLNGASFADAVLSFDGRISSDDLKKIYSKVNEIVIRNEHRGAGKVFKYYDHEELLSFSCTIITWKETLELFEHILRQMTPSDDDREYVIRSLQSNFNAIFDTLSSAFDGEKVLGKDINGLLNASDLNSLAHTLELDVEDQDFISLFKVDEAIADFAEYDRAQFQEHFARVPISSVVLKYAVELLSSFAPTLSETQRGKEEGKSLTEILTDLFEEKLLNLSDKSYLDTVLPILATLPSVSSCYVSVGSSSQKQSVDEEIVLEFNPNFEEGDSIDSLVLLSSSNKGDPLGTTLTKEQGGVGFQILQNNREVVIPNVLETDGEVHFLRGAAPEQAEGKTFWYIGIPLHDANGNANAILGFDNFQSGKELTNDVEEEIKSLGAVVDEQLSKVAAMHRLLRYSSSVKGYFEGRIIGVKVYLVHKNDRTGADEIFEVCNVSTSDDEVSSLSVLEPVERNPETEVIWDSLKAKEKCANEFVGAVDGHQQVVHPLTIEGDVRGLVSFQEPVQESESGTRNEFEKILSVVKSGIKGVAKENIWKNMNKILGGLKVSDDIKEELIFPALMLSYYNQELGSLDSSALAELKSYKSPPVVVHKVVRALLLMFGNAPKDLKTWKDCAAQLNLKLIRKIRAFDPTSIMKKRPFTLAKTAYRRIIKGDVAKRGSVPTQIMYNWQGVSLTLRTAAVDARKREKARRALQDNQEFIVGEDHELPVDDDELVDTEGLEADEDELEALDETLDLEYVDAYDVSHDHDNTNPSGTSAGD
eukprot:Nk52_evm14s179 gene=Nk52_evmTU14s179